MVAQTGDKILTNTKLLVFELLTLTRYSNLDVEDNGSEMGKELETTAKTFLGGVQIVRTRNQNIPDVSNPSKCLLTFILVCFC